MLRAEMTMLLLREGELTIQVSRRGQQPQGEAVVEELSSTGAVQYKARNNTTSASALPQWGHSKLQRYPADAVFPATAT